MCLREQKLGGLNSVELMEKILEEIRNKNIACKHHVCSGDNGFIAGCQIGVDVCLSVVRDEIMKLETPYPKDVFLEISGENLIKIRESIESTGHTLDGVVAVGGRIAFQNLKNNVLSLLEGEK